MAIATLRQIHVAVSPFPTAGEPVWDDCAFEWCLTDSDGIHYWGDTPSQCYGQFCEALHYLAESARKAGFSVAELRELRAQQRDWADQRAEESPY